MRPVSLSGGGETTTGGAGDPGEPCATYCDPLDCSAANVQFDSTALELHSALNGLGSIISDSAKVSYLEGTTACKEEGGNVIRIELLRDFGTTTNN